MAFSVTIVKVAPVYRQGVNLQWEVTDAPAGVLTYTVERSGSPAGGWELLESSTDTYVYQDTSADLDGLTRDVYYRVTVEAPSGPTAVSAAHNIRDELTQGAAGRHYFRHRKMRTDLLRTLQKFSGRQFYALKRKHWGTRCTNCWDDVTKTKVFDNCGVCFGASFVGGYYEPHLIWARLDVSTTQAPLQLEGKADQRMFRLLCLDFPLLTVDDVLVAKDSDRRFLVHSQTDTEMKLVPVHQELSLAELARDHPAYSITMPTTSVDY